MRIGYILAESYLGRLLVATTPKGICSLMLGDSEEDLLGELRQKFPRAEIVPQAGMLQDQVAAIVDWLAGRSPQPELPLDEQGTPFQKRVWAELRRIPRGERISYSELARRIGRPKAVRAVASACARNPVAIITPCHRVVRLNGDLGGYRWGIERKRRLLKAEQE